MLKTIAVILGILLIGSWIAGYVFWGDSKKKIEKAENDLKNYREQYRMVIHKGDSIDAVITGLRGREENYKGHIDSLENIVGNLKTESAVMQERTAMLFQPSELADQMRVTFPELKTAPLGIARVPHPETGFIITTFQVPVQFVSTFIDDHNKVANFRKQNAALMEINFTYKDYIALQDTIINLKEQKAQEYRKGLDYGLAKYEEVMKEYIQTLKNPPKIEWPSVAAIVGAGLAGAAAGVLIKK
jgi:hypothetical protein